MNKEFSPCFNVGSKNTQNKPCFVLFLYLKHTDVVTAMLLLSVKIDLDQDRQLTILYVFLYDKVDIKIQFDIYFKYQNTNQHTGVILK